MKRIIKPLPGWIKFNIREIRKANNMSVRELSSLAAINEYQIKSLETNKRSIPTLYTLAKIARVLNVNINDLYNINYDELPLERNVDIVGEEKGEII